MINMVGTDPNAQDNWAQENLDVVASVTASPFHAVAHRYTLTNPFDQPQLFYFRADGVPPGWDVDLTPRKIRLGPGERMFGQATITPAEDAKVCTSEWIEVTSWTPRGDTLVSVGGGVVQVDLRRPTSVNLEADAGRCDDKDLERIIEEAKEAGQRLDADAAERRCGRIQTRGCLDPPVAGVEVILRYVDPLGNIVYHTAVTDANGCYEDFMVSTTGGTWQVDAEYPGGDCDGPSRTPPVTVCKCP
jgi:hypothetical protein